MILIYDILFIYKYLYINKKIEIKIIRYNYDYI